MLSRKKHKPQRICKCVRFHNPDPQAGEDHHIFPVGWGGPEKGELVFLCPTSHTNVHELLRAWKAWNGKPPWEISRHFSPYIRDLAQLGFEMYNAAKI